jgi:putative endonuclease
MYYLYLLRCADNSLYCGITTDVARRVHEHNSSLKGARYTCCRRPVVLVYTRVYKTRSRAQSAEVRVKQMRKNEKERLIAVSR